MSQAGRAPSSLEAERNSAELRSRASIPIIRRTSSQSMQQRSSSSSSNADSRSPALNRRPSYIPAVPSPLNPFSSQSSEPSISSSDEGAVVEGDVSPIETPTSADGPRSQNTYNIPAFGKPRRKGSSNLSPAQELLRQKSAPAMRPDEIPRPDTPKRLTDLGRDYSRYPSSVDLRSNSRPPEPKARVGVAAVPLLRTTTTNPFSDSQADLERFGYPDDSISKFTLSNVLGVPRHLVNPEQCSFILENFQSKYTDF